MTKDSQRTRSVLPLLSRHVFQKLNNERVPLQWAHEDGTDGSSNLIPYTARPMNGNSSVCN